MKLIVGLGNPGKDYENTIHNIGFTVLDQFANAKGLSFSKAKFNAAYTEFENNGEKVMLLKPMEYINLSGQSIAKIIKYYKIDINDVLIVQDDLDIELGKYKLKANGRDGGHNGMKSIIQSLGTNEIKRLKIGIGNDKNKETKAYVLGKLSEEEAKLMLEVINNAEEIISDFIDIDFILLMNKYN